jgi:hypothetical protein
MILHTKIRELSVLSLLNSIRPQELMLDKKRQPIGYIMRSVDSAWVL